jgi:O-acetyl-ADP-ribose deacetylase (regulator of RNase III)
VPALAKYCLDNLSNVEPDVRSKIEFRYFNYETLKEKELPVVDGDSWAIINAANDDLDQGRGVCGHIFEAAGPAELKAACEVVKKQRKTGLKPGQACSTSSFKIGDDSPFKHIIHTVAPKCTTKGHPSDVEQQQLSNAIEAAFDAARNLKVRSLMICCLGSGARDRRVRVMRVATVVREWCALRCVR